MAENINILCLACDTNPGFTNKPTHYPLEYGDFLDVDFDYRTQNCRFF